MKVDLITLKSVKNYNINIIFQLIQCISSKKEIFSSDVSLKDLILNPIRILLKPYKCFKF